MKGSGSTPPEASAASTASASTPADQNSQNQVDTEQVSGPGEERFGSGMAEALVRRGRAGWEAGKAGAASAPGGTTRSPRRVACWRCPWTRRSVLADGQARASPVRHRARLLTFLIEDGKHASRRRCVDRGRGEYLGVLMDT